MSSLPKKLALVEVPDADRNTALNFKQLGDTINKLLSHVSSLPTSSQVSSASTGTSNSLSTLEAEITELQTLVNSLPTQNRRYLLGVGT